MRKGDTKFITAICNPLFDLFRVMNLKIQRHLGILRAKLSQGLRQDMLRRDNHRCQIQAPNDDLPQLSNLVFRSSHSLEQFIRMAVEKHACFCQIHAPSNSAEECDPESAFQLLYLCRK